MWDKFIQLGPWIAAIVIPLLVNHFSNQHARRLKADPDIPKERLMTFEHILSELAHVKKEKEGCMAMLVRHESRIRELERENERIESQLDLCLRLLKGKSGQPVNDDSSGSRAALFPPTFKQED